MKYRHAVLALALGGAGALHAATPLPLSKEAYRAQQQRIEAEYQAAKARCKPRERQERAVCEERVRGARDVTLAELELRVQPNAKNDEKLRMARAEAAYAVARKQCNALDGHAEEVCRKDAKAAFAAARAEAKLVAAATADSLRSQATVRERTVRLERDNEVRFAAAVERCEMLAGDARDECLANARQRFGKM